MTGAMPDAVEPAPLTAPGHVPGQHSGRSDYVLMPQLGDAVVEGTVCRWLKKEGEYVKRNEPLMEIDNDLISAEYPSNHTGVLRILVEEDKKVAVGTRLAVIEEIHPEWIEETSSAAHYAPAPTYSAPALEGSRQSGDRQSRDRSYPIVPAWRSTPLVRRLAAELGVDLNNVTGTGVGGRIRRQDVMETAAALRNQRSKE